jgi:predicted nucleic acid-binding protein
MRPEQLVEPVTGLELGIDENDLWIAAQSLAYNLTLVTADQDMKRIAEFSEGQLHLEDWTKV